MSSRTRPVQLTLPATAAPNQAAAHGGKRANCGRKRKTLRPCVRHLPRPAHDRRHPMHITLRVRREVGFLRKERVLRVVVARVGRATSDAFRVLHYSVQTDHLHLVVEAENELLLARKMNGLTTWLARSVNRLLGRRGPFFADRYHRHDLRTPTEVRNALLYVLQNRRKHEYQRTGHVLGGVDAYSSAPWFATGFADDASRAVRRARREAERILRLARDATPPLAAPTTWLANAGWLRARRGRLSLREVPAAPVASRP